MRPLMRPSSINWPKSPDSWHRPFYSHNISLMLYQYESDELTTAFLDKAQCLKAKGELYCPFQFDGMNLLDLAAQANRSINLLPFKRSLSERPKFSGSIRVVETLHFNALPRQATRGKLDVHLNTMLQSGQASLERSHSWSKQAICLGQEVRDVPKEDPMQVQDIFFKALIHWSTPASDIPDSAKLSVELLICMGS